MLFIHFPINFLSQGTQTPRKFNHLFYTTLSSASTSVLEQVNPQERRAAPARLRATGFGWVRQRLDWAKLEPSPGAYDWISSDALIQDIVAAALVPVIVLDGSPAWARAPQDQPPTANPWRRPPISVTSRFAAVLATRYRDELTFYQIWDEPNIAPHWGNRLIEPVATHSCSR
ncbi:MAG: hypothetical protein R2867_22070 [Caldilineaceae bacterium]